jgi:glycosyltransferase involved in cell wall biosynthesis
MTGPSLSVLIPSYNHAAYVGAALDSLWAQTRLPDQVLVIDDGSTDGSVAVIEQALARAPGAVRCALRVQANRGIAATRNALVAAVDSDLIAFLDSDDIYAPTRLTRLTADWQPHRPYFAASGVGFVAEPGGDLGDGWEATYRLLLSQGMAFPSAGFALLRAHFLISASNYVMSHHLVEQAGGFDPGLQVCQEWDLTLRLLPEVEPRFIPEPLLHYRRHGSNTSRRSQARIPQEIAHIYRKAAAWLGRSSVNPLAPTPVNWPMFFKVFIRLCQTLTGRPVLDYLPAECLTTDVAAPDATGPQARRDRLATQRLLALAREERPPDPVPLVALMQGCQRSWATP